MSNAVSETNETPRLTDTAKVWEPRLVCRNCDSDDVRKVEWVDIGGEPDERLSRTGWQCRTCGAIEDTLYERNDLAEAIDAYKRQDGATRHQLAAVIEHAEALEEELEEWLQGARRRQPTDLRLVY